MQEIVIEISADGERVTIEGKDIQGTECTALTKGIESALGVVEKRTLKPEYRNVAHAKRTAKA